MLIGPNATLDPGTFTITGIDLDVYGSLLVNTPTFAGNYAFSTTTLESGSTVNYATDQTIDHKLSYFNLTLSGAGTDNLDGNTVVKGNFNIGNSTIFDPDGNIVTVNSSFVNNGTVALTVTGITAANKTYDGTTKATINTSVATLKGSIVIGANAVTLNTAGATGAFNSKDVGIANIVTVSGLTLSGTDIGQYTLTQPTTPANITPAPLTIGAVSDSIKYNGTTTSSLTPTTSILYGTDKVMGLSQSFNSQDVLGAGLSTISVNPGYIVNDGNNGNNYKVTLLTTSGTINPAPLTITATGPAITYGTAYVGGSSTTNFTYSGTVHGETITSAILTPNPNLTATTPANTPYTVTPSAPLGANGFLASNYNITPVIYNGIIKPATLTALTVTGITANNKAYNDNTTASLDYGKLTLVGLISGETNLTLVTTNAVGAFASKNVGNGITVNVSGLTLSGPNASDYTLIQPTTRANITPAPLTVKASNQTKTYGTTSTLGTTAFTTTGTLYGSDSVTGVTLTSSGSPLTATVNGGPYNITPSAAVGTGLSNYAITYKNGSLTVNPATLTVTANNGTKTYGTTVNLTYSITGLVNKDKVTSVTLSSPGVATTANVQGSPYTITPSNANGAGLNNYMVVYVSGQLTVNPASLTITANNATKTYGTTANLTGFTVQGLVNGNKVTSVSLTSAGTAATATVNGGTPYTITASGATGSGLSNYTITYKNGNLTVNPATLTITADNVIKVYGTTANLTGYTVSGLVNGNTITGVTLTSAGSVSTAKVSKSPYSIIPSAAVGTGLSNYKIIYVSGKLFVVSNIFSSIAGDINLADLLGIGFHNAPPVVIISSSGTIVIPSI